MTDTTPLHRSFRLSRAKGRPVTAPFVFGALMPVLLMVCALIIPYNFEIFALITPPAMAHFVFTLMCNHRCEKSSASATDFALLLSATCIFAMPCWLGYVLLDLFGIHPWLHNTTIFYYLPF